MDSWRILFEASASGVEDREELEIEYLFGNPATDQEIVNVQNELGLDMPDELRSMLNEFNGIEIREKYWGPEPRPLYLSTDNMLVDVPEYIRESGNPMPSNEQLTRAIFFAHQNGFAELYAVCVNAFEGFRAGEILCFDHETGAFELEQNSLRRFVGRSEYCHLG